MTFQRKYDDAFEQKAVATVLQKGKKSHRNRPILGINEFLVYEWKGHFHPSLTDPGREISTGEYVRTRQASTLCHLGGNKIILYPSLGGI